MNNSNKTTKRQKPLVPEQPYVSLRVRRAREKQRLLREERLAIAAARAVNKESR